MKQSKFSGSDREIRGKILRLVLAKKKVSVGEIESMIPQSTERVRKIAAALTKEGFIKERADTLLI